jgi:uncharacterized membrane protein
VNIKSLEDVVRKYINLAEQKTEDARSSYILPFWGVRLSSYILPFWSVRLSSYILPFWGVRLSSYPER